MLIIDTYRDLMEQERLTEQEKVVIEQWKSVLDELDRTENCNNRRHKEKRDIVSFRNRENIIRRNKMRLQKITYTSIIKLLYVQRCFLKEKVNYHIGFKYPY